MQLRNNGSQFIVYYGPKFSFKWNFEPKLKETFDHVDGGLNRQLTADRKDFKVEVALSWRIHEMSKPLKVRPLKKLLHFEDFL